MQDYWPRLLSTLQRVDSSVVFTKTQAVLQVEVTCDLPLHSSLKDYLKLEFTGIFSSDKFFR